MVVFLVRAPAAWVAFAIFIEVTVAVGIAVTLQVLDIVAFLVLMPVAPRVPYAHEEVGVPHRHLHFRKQELR